MQDYCQIEDIINILSNIGIIIENIDKDSSIFLNEYIEDSIAFISFVVEIENVFGIEIPDEYLLFSEMETLSDVCNIINSIKAYN